MHFPGVTSGSWCRKPIRSQPLLSPPASPPVAMACCRAPWLLCFEAHRPAPVGSVPTARAEVPPLGPGGRPVPAMPGHSPAPWNSSQSAGEVRGPPAGSGPATKAQRPSPVPGGANTGPPPVRPGTSASVPRVSAAASRRPVRCQRCRWAPRRSGEDAAECTVASLNLRGPGSTQTHAPTSLDETPLSSCASTHSGP